MLFNAAGILVKTHTESILNVLDALIGEEGFGSMLVWRKCGAKGSVGVQILGGR